MEREEEGVRPQIDILIDDFLFSERGMGWAGLSFCFFGTDGGKNNYWTTSF